MTTENTARLRVVFQKGTEIKYISHLDLARAWERALRRARINLVYSLGFNPRPKLVFASALPVGVTGCAELMDVVVERRIAVPNWASRVKQQLPVGLGLVSVSEVPDALLSLPSQLRASEYRVLLRSSDSPAALQARLDGLLAQETIIRHRDRPGRERIYDLRPLIQRLWIIDRRLDCYAIGMQLQSDAQGTGRPDEVMAALGLAEATCGIERERLLLLEES